jgi:glycosyltransferase involved in cell wall biosynthesis
MRIALFIKSTTFHSNFGGLETQNKVLCEGLVNRGHEIVVFTPQKDLPDKEKTLNNVKYVFILASYRYLFSSLNPNSWERRSVEVFRKHHGEKRFDLALSQSSAGIGIIKKKEEFEIKTISIAHGTAVGEFLTQAQNIKNVKDVYWTLRNLQYVLRQYFGRQREFILCADKVIAVSHAVKKQLLDETFALEGNVVVVHNGLDPKKFEGIEKKNHGGSVHIVYTGRVVRSKGLFDFVNILKQISEENIIFDIIGGGEDTEELKSFVNQLGLKDKVIFHGKVEYGQVITKLFDSDIYVLPSKRVEGFPMTLPEAMFASLPVIGTNIGGISDAIEDGKTGFLIEQNAYDMMKEKLLLLIKDKNLREYMGKNGRMKAEKEFSLEVMLNKYEQIFSEVLG